ncbi:MAG: FAD-linked oxidase C-terminal domain-containing protein [Desulfococcaceae bacterium]
MGRPPGRPLRPGPAEADPGAGGRHRAPRQNSGHGSGHAGNRQGIRVPIGAFGHGGDGDLHPAILADKRDKAEWARVEKAIDAIFHRALAMGGALSGEHGARIAKSCYLENETGAATIVLSRRVKQALDLDNILNPGKIIGG